MYAAYLSPGRRGSTCFVQADEQKNLEQDPALQVTRVRDGAKTRKAAASRLRRNSKAPFELISPTEFVERAELKSSASFETQLLLPAMFQVSVSYLMRLLSLSHPHQSTRGAGRERIVHLALKLRVTFGEHASRPDDC